MKRSLVILHNDDTEPIELELKKATQVKSESEFIYFEKINDEWRLTFSTSAIEDFSKVDCLQILRND